MGDQAPRGGKRRRRLAHERAAGAADAVWDRYLKIRDGSPHFWLDFTLRGHRIRASTGTPDRAAAREVVKQVYADMHAAIVMGRDAAKPVAAPARSLTWDEAATLWWERQGRHTDIGQQTERYTVREVGRYLALHPDRWPLGIHTPLHELDDAWLGSLVAAWRAGDDLGVGEVEYAPGRTRHYPRRPNSPRTVNLKLKRIRAVIDAARADGALAPELDYAAHRRREPAARRVYLSPDEALRAIAAMPRHAQNVVLLAILTALRHGNVVGLQWEEVSLDTGWLHVRQKGGRPLDVELIPAARRFLAMLQPDPDRRRGPVFTWGDPEVGCACPRCTHPRLFRGEPIRGIARSFKAAQKRAGVRAFRFHDLRHTVADLVLRTGGGLKNVQGALGHASMSSTVVYTSREPQGYVPHLQQAVEGIYEGVIRSRIGGDDGGPTKES